MDIKDTMHAMIDCINIDTKSKSEITVTMNFEAHHIPTVEIKYKEAYIDDNLFPDSRRG